MNKQKELPNGWAITLENLCCCGNCEHYDTVIVCDGSRKPDEYCDEWKSDQKTRKVRKA